MQRNARRTWLASHALDELAAIRRGKRRALPAAWGSSTFTARSRANPLLLQAVWRCGSRLLMFDRWWWRTQSLDGALRHPHTVGSMLRILGNLRQAMQIVLPDERLYWLVFNGSVNIGTVALPLVQAGFAAEVLHSTSDALPCVECKVSCFEWTRDAFAVPSCCTMPHSCANLVDTHPAAPATLRAAMQLTGEIPSTRGVCFVPSADRSGGPSRLSPVCVEPLCRTMSLVLDSLEKISSSSRPRDAAFIVAPSVPRVERAVCGRGPAPASSPSFYLQRMLMRASWGGAGGGVCVVCGGGSGVGAGAVRPEVPHLEALARGRGVSVLRRPPGAPPRPPPPAHRRVTCFVANKAMQRTCDKCIQRSF